jgi:hypothetical protein
MSLLTTDIFRQAQAHLMVAIIMFVLAAATASFAFLFYLDESPWWTAAFSISVLICGHIGIRNSMKWAEVLRFARSLRCEERGIRKA